MHIGTYCKIYSYQEPLYHAITYGMTFWYTNQISYSQHIPMPHRWAIIGARVGGGWRLGWRVGWGVGVEKNDGVIRRFNRLRSRFASVYRILIPNATVIYVSGLIFNVVVYYRPQQLNKYGHQWQMTHDKIFHVISTDTVRYCLESSQLTPLQLVPGGIHWNKNVILTKFSSLLALEVVIDCNSFRCIQWRKFSSKLHLFPFQYKTVYFFDIQC